LAKLGLLLAISLLRWSEGDEAASNAVFFNKDAATGSSPSFACSEDGDPQAGRGGEVGIFLRVARYAVSSLLAGLGGEEELECGVLVLDRGGGPCPIRRCGVRLVVASA
jgi:hypothetical protein